MESFAQNVVICVLIMNRKGRAGTVNLKVNSYSHTDVCQKFKNPKFMLRVTRSPKKCK